MSETTRTIKKLLGETCDIDPTTILDHHRLVALGLDSVRAADFVIAIEEEMDLVISPAEAVKLRTVAEVVCFVDQLK